MNRREALKRIPALAAVAAIGTPAANGREASAADVAIEDQLWSPVPSGEAFDDILYFVDDGSDAVTFVYHPSPIGPTVDVDVENFLRLA